MTREIPLTKGRVTLVDDDLYPVLSRFHWSVDGSGYAQRAVKTDRGWRPIRMHRDILGLVGSEMGDHRNLNKLDNRRENLRRCDARGNVRSRGLNCNNKTGYKGVHFNAARNCYQTYITVDYHHVYLGRYGTAKEGAEAYNEAARKYHGEFAKQNEFPESS